MLFSQADPKDHKSVDVCTFTPDEGKDEIVQLVKYINIIASSQDRLIENYQNLDWNDQQAISIFMQQDKIVGFSTVWNRDFYGPKTVRIFNKWWEDPSLRRTSKIIGDSHLVTVAKHQLCFAKKQGFDWAFISRKRSPKYLKKIVAVLNDRTDFNWNFHKKKIAVCYPQAESCWQWVGYTNLKSSNDKWDMLNE